MSMDIKNYFEGEGKIRFMDIYEAMPQKHFLEKSDITFLIPPISYITDGSFDIRKYILRGAYRSLEDFPDVSVALEGTQLTKERYENDKLYLSNGMILKKIKNGLPIYEIESSQVVISGGGPMRLVFDINKYHEDVIDDFKKFIMHKVSDIINPYLVASTSFLAWAKMKGELNSYEKYVSYNPMDTFYIIVAPQATQGRLVAMDKINAWYNDTLGMYISRSGDTYADYVKLLQPLATELKFDQSGTIEAKTANREAIVAMYSGDVSSLLMDELRFMIFRTTVDIMIGGYKGISAYSELIHIIDIYSNFKDMSSSVLFDTNMPNMEFPSIVSAVMPFMRSDFCHFKLRKKNNLSQGRITFESQSDLGVHKFDGSGQTFYMLSKDYSHQPFSSNILENLNRMTEI